MSKVSDQDEIDRAEMMSEYHYGIVDFWVGIFSIGIAFPLFGWFRTNKAIKIAQQHDWEISTGLIAYNVLTIILVVVKGLFIAFVETGQLLG